MLSKYPLLECCLIKRFYAVIMSLLFYVNSFNLVRIFVINLVIFYTFFRLLLPWPSNCAVYVYLCIVTFELIQQLALRHYQHAIILELKGTVLFVYSGTNGLSKKFQFSNYIIINSVFRCDFLLSVLYVFSFVCYLYIFIMFLCCLFIRHMAVVPAHKKPSRK